MSEHEYAEDIAPHDPREVAESRSMEVYSSHPWDPDPFPQVTCQVTCLVTCLVTCPLVTP